MSRGVPRSLVILPNGLFGKLMLSTSVTAGLAKFTWFQMLKKSVVNRRLWRSVILKFLINEKSQFCWPGPRKVLRPRLPNPVVQKLGSVRHSVGYNSAAVVNAAGFR